MIFKNQQFATTKKGDTDALKAHIKRLRDLGKEVYVC